MLLQAAGLALLASLSPTALLIVAVYLGSDRPRLIAAFIDDPTFAKLPLSCVEHFEKSVRPPLWPDRLGARF